MRVPWKTVDGRDRSLNFKAGKVGRPLISVNRLLEAGFVVYLSPQEAYILNPLSGEKYWLVRKSGMFILEINVQVKVPFTRP